MSGGKSVGVGVAGLAERGEGIEEVGDGGAGGAVEAPRDGLDGHWPVGLTKDAAEGEGAGGRLGRPRLGLGRDGHGLGRSEVDDGLGRLAGCLELGAEVADEPCGLLSLAFRR